RGRPGVGPREQREDRHGDESERDEPDRVVAAVHEDVLGDRPLVTLLRHDEHGREVDEDSGAAEDGEDDEPEPEDGRGEIEVAPEAAAYAGEDPAVAAAREALGLWCVEDVFAHAPRVPQAGARGYPESPWSDPQRYSRPRRWPRRRSPRTAARGTTTSSSNASRQGSS